VTECVLCGVDVDGDTVPRASWVPDDSKRDLCGPCGLRTLTGAEADHEVEIPLSYDEAERLDRAAAVTGLPPEDLSRVLFVRSLVTGDADEALGERFGDRKAAEEIIDGALPASSGGRTA